MESKFSLAQDLMRQAGALVHKQMAEIFEVTIKSSQDDIVTSVDTMVQSFFIRTILERYPEDCFLAEEEDCQHSISEGNVWVIDPIDGTLNFVTQKSDFAIMLSYFENGVGQFGLIYDVMADKLYAGGGKFPVTCNHAELPAFDGRPLNQSIVACNTGILLRNEHNLLELVKDSLGVRNYGCAGLSMVKVLNNQLWCYSSSICPWDYAAASIMGEALGYELLTLDGQALDFSSRQAVIFVPSQYKAEVLGKLSSL